MSLVGFIGAILMLVIVLVFTIAPLLFTQYESNTDFRNKQRERALAYYERVLTNLRDLEDDLGTGKISEDEYQLEREKWMSRGAELLAMIDELDQQHNLVSNLNDHASDAEIDHAIEQAITHAREQRHATEMS